MCVRAFFVYLGVLGLSGLAPPAAAVPRAARVDVVFTEDCEDLVVAAVKRARREILVAIYTFSNREIVEALVDAKNRGVEVRIKADAKQISYDAAEAVFEKLRDAEVEVETIEMPSWYHMHHKFMIIDSEVVLTGSYNFTVAASTKNYENLVLIISSSIARQFIKEFEAIESK